LVYEPTLKYQVPEARPVMVVVVAPAPGTLDDWLMVVGEVP
jgi:hypothetical protein